MASSLQSPSSLPVIDISQFPKEIVGDHLRYHAEVLSVSKDLVSMPVEAKDRIATSNRVESYIRTPRIPIPFETFCFLDMPNPDSILEMSRKIWPEEGNSDFCYVIRLFFLHFTTVVLKINRLCTVFFMELSEPRSRLISSSLWLL
ncbi:hypothetical protein SUGI_0852650 [Cryptomeria japonica]|nr:hypothetical protein SUGI_0852650 [Cryptomeria japonica]